jgi:ornithine cyclodeaminase
MTAAPRTATGFLSAERTASLLRQQGMPVVMDTLARYIEEDFRRWPEFDKCARVANHSRDGVIELMPVADTQRYAFKYVNGHPKNTRLSLPTVMAFGVLADVDTGMPLLISELTLMTAVRTAATSALAARRLARTDSRRMALIGNGAQSEFQALAFNRLLGIDTFHLFDTDPAATDKLAAHLGALGFHVKRFDATADAVRGVDIVTTATADKANATIITPDMLEPGMHINGVGGDCPGKTELHAEVLRRSRVFVEYAPQTRIEGEIQQMPGNFPVTELWTVLTGAAPGRERAEEITVFDSVGFALEDYSALRFLSDLAKACGVEDRISLIPDLPDPKNLFSLVSRADGAVPAQANLAA